MQSRCSRSSSAHRSQVGPCPCGLFHEPGSSLCTLYAADGVDDHFAGGVDCTLSLSTPSTRTLSRQTSNFCWNMFQPTKQQQQESIGGAYSKGRGRVAGEEALAARRCANCDTTSTPLWRNGPRGPKVRTQSLFSISFPSFLQASKLCF